MRSGNCGHYIPRPERVVTAPQEIPLCFARSAASGRATFSAPLRELLLYWQSPTLRTPPDLAICAQAFSVKKNRVFDEGSRRHDTPR